MKRSPQWVLVLYRAWINQPSTAQPHHNLHGRYCIVADTKEIAEQVTGQLCVEYTNESPAHIGLGWDEETGFEQPFAEPPIS